MRVFHDSLVGRQFSPLFQKMIAWWLHADYTVCLETKSNLPQFKSRCSWICSMAYTHSPTWLALSLPAADQPWNMSHMGSPVLALPTGKLSQPPARSEPPFLEFPGPCHKGAQSMVCILLWGTKAANNSADYWLLCYSNTAKKHHFAKVLQNRSFDPQDPFRIGLELSWFDVHAMNRAHSCSKNCLLLCGRVTKGLFSSCSLIQF